MKSALFYLLFLVTFNSFSQNVDSIEYKLKKMKSLLDSGYITTEDYNTFKSTMFFQPQPEVSNNVKSITVDQNLLFKRNQLKTYYIVYYSVGSASMALGLSLIGYATYYKNNKFPTSGTSLNALKQAYNQYVSNYKKLYGIGGGLTGLGLILNIVGTTNLIKFNRINLGLSSNGNNLGLLLTIK